MLHPQQNLEVIIAQLKSEGYNIATAEDSVLIAWDIPYLNSSGSIRRGILAFPIGKINEDWMPVVDHTAYFKGDIPHNTGKVQLPWIISTNEQWNIAGGVGTAKIRMSCKKKHPDNALSTYRSIEEKLKVYVSIIESHAKRIDPSVSAQTFGEPPDLKPIGPFYYPDSASSRNGIGNLNEKFLDKKIGIIGLGGTGSYILDLVAKTHVSEIHLYDSDVFDSHNAFRAPGAASIDEVNQCEAKVARYARIYGVSRKGIFPHKIDVSEDNKEEISFLDFVFLAVDNDFARSTIILLLEGFGIPYIDVGMFAQMSGSIMTCLGGRTRTTFWYPSLPKRIKSVQNCDASKEDDYSSNIQIAELNALNASCAVIKWKKYMNFYHDYEKETMSLYDSNKNSLVNIYKSPIFRTKFVRAIPDSLQAGVLYISLKYKTASHLCPCGCKHKVVTPFSNNGWKLTLFFNIATLSPSVGNGRFACHSHYWIRRNKVIWAYPI